MSRVLIAIGIAAVVCVVIFGTVIGFLLIRGRAEDESSAKAAHDIVLSIVSTWNEDAFMANSSQELKKVVTPEDTVKFFKTYRRLGALQSLGTPEGEAQATVGFGSIQSGVTATYRMQATFANGPASIRVRLRKIDEKWQMDAFYVNSKVFLQ